MIGRIGHFYLMLGLLLISCTSLAQETLSLDELLKRVEQGSVQDTKVAQQREAEFIQNKARQEELLRAARKELDIEEQRSKILEKQHTTNEERLRDEKERLNERLGSLKELFGVLQQTAGDAHGQFEHSLTQLQFPDRLIFLEELNRKIGKSSKLATLDEIERLWFELQREMVESGKVVRFPTAVLRTDGSEVQRIVTRVGIFNLVADGRYLSYAPETGRVIELSRQPGSRFLEGARLIETVDSGMVPFAIDPSRGQILSLILEVPTLIERIEQGGIVGYVILLLGGLALVIAVERLFVLTLISARVRAQSSALDQPGNNPLGRVLKIFHDNRALDVETLELKLDEAILKEVPRLNRGLMLLKIIAVVAPLLGLLGTVTGMIITFQAITLYGTGDPKLMAGGISQALVTTVQGLCVAIPTVLLHALVSSPAKRLVQILEEQATGMVAQQSERLAAAEG